MDEVGVLVIIISVGFVGILISAVLSEYPVGGETVYEVMIIDKGKELHTTTIMAGNVPVFSSHWYYYLKVDLDGRTEEIEVSKDAWVIARVGDYIPVACRKTLLGSRSCYIKEVENEDWNNP